MLLHLTAKFAHDGFDLAHRGVEGFPDRDLHVFALGRVGAGLVDHNIVMLGHCDAKLDMKRRSAPVTGLRPIDDDMTARDSRAELLEAAHLLGDLRPGLFRRLAMPKDDFDWGLHIDPSALAFPQGRIIRLW